jgi:endoglucanase
MNSQKKSWGLLGQGLAIITLIAALTGCGGSSDASSADSTASASGAGVAGVSPSVSGTPQTTVAVNNRYSFRPTVANPTGIPLTFNIQNKPSWASFGETTGELTGTPTAPDAGHYSNIVISANDGSTTSGLPAFSIEVTPASATGSSSSSSGSSSSSSGSSSGAATSANGSMIPSATQLVDSAHNVWSVSAGVVRKNGAAAGTSYNVIVLLYDGGTIYQENKSCLWFAWAGSAWSASSNPAPTLTPACSSTVASAPASSNSTATPTGDFGIQVKGNQFVSAKDGSPVQIVGTQMSGLETGRTGRWPQFANAGTAFWSSLINYRGSGLNTVRFPLNEASWLNYTCYDSGTGASGGLYSATSGGGYTPDPNNVYQATVKKAVADATAAGLYVILVDFWGAPNNAAGQSLCPIGQPGFANADHSLAFWKSVADTFKGNPAVIFELFNEPFGANVYNDWVVQSGSSTFTPGSDGATLLNGGAYYPFDQQNNSNGNAIQSIPITWQVAGMQTMLNTVRAEGASNVVLTSPMGWAGEIETWLATRPTDPIGQLGAAWHLYGYAKGTAPPLAVRAAGFPIAITETYGFDSALNGGSNANGYTWAASNSIGYAWCCWNDWGSQSSLAVAIADEGAPWYMAPAP